MRTPSRSHHILALRLPGNVERVVNDLRSELYNLTAATSTQALPPILPLAYVSPGTSEETVGLLPQTEIAPLQVGPIGPHDETHGKTLVLRIEMEELWREWLRGFVAKPAPRGMPVPLAGVFLGGTDLADSWSSFSARDERRRFEDLRSALPKRLTVLQVELLSIHTRASGRWWDDIDWEIPWSKRIKLRGQIVTI